MIGKTLNKYRIVEHLGSGGMAEVYKAYHPGLDCYVAVKVLHSFLASEEDFLTRFQREAKIVASFRHPNIVQVYDFDYDAENNVYYMVMEFVDGPNLKIHLQGIVKNKQMMPLEEAVRIAVDVASALEYAHKQGMVHRDIKPANIIFTHDGQVILSDFGIARMINTATLTASGAMVGTPAYIAPEQGVGKAGDERSDIYSLGAVLYQLVTGTLPFDADTPLGIVLKHINAPLTPPTQVTPNLPSAVEAVIMRALAKDPDIRYQTASEFADDLKKALAGEHVEPIPIELVGTPTSVEILTTPHIPVQVASTGEYYTLPGKIPTLLPTVSKARPGRGRIAALVTGLVLILLTTIALFVVGRPNHLFAALFPDATPTEIGAPTFTPDIPATQQILATQVASGIDAALATRDALATYEATINAPPTPTLTSTPTPTPDLTATAIAACTFDLQITRDRAIWPRVLMPRQQFVKRWTVKNTGTCDWPASIHLVFVSGDELDVVQVPEIEPLAPGETTEVKLSLRAPTAYTSYSSVWQLQDGAEKAIGEELTVACRVGPTPTPLPTATATVTPTSLLSPTPTLDATPTEMFASQITDYTLDRWWLDEANRTWHAKITLYAAGGDGTYTFYVNEVSEDSVFINGVDELSAEKCRPLIVTFYVTSAGHVTYKKLWIPYPYPPDCD